jgi:HD superfamily phosphodiesterase
VQEVINAMNQYFGKDQKRIDHAVSVLNYAREINSSEKADKDIVEAAAILHDIGIHEAEKRYQSTAGKHQMELGPAIASEILNNLGKDHRFIESVNKIIGNHHILNGDSSKEFQVVYEADWLVNLQDDFKDWDNKKKGAVINKNFKTTKGTELALKILKEEEL